MDLTDMTVDEFNDLVSKHGTDDVYDPSDVERLILAYRAERDRLDYLNARRQDGEKWTYTHYTFDDRFRFYIGCWKGGVGTFKTVRECIDFARGKGV